MGAVYSIDALTAFIDSLKRQNKKIVLVGGCFDILHAGHVIFLQKAKKAGDALVVMLESDQKVRDLKGASRPVFHQKDRAKILSALSSVDYIVMLPYLRDDLAYDELIGRIRPDVIAASGKDLQLSHHKRSAKKVGAKFKLVSPLVGNYSTSKVFAHDR